MSNKGTGAVMGEQDQMGGAVPKLRFPEFRDARAWQTVALEDVLRPTSREVAKPESSFTGLGLRSHGKGTFQKADQDPDKIAMDRLYVVHRDDLIVNITFAWEGAIAIANDSDHGLYVSHRFPTYEFKSGVSSPDFFRYVITDKAFVYRLGVISPGGAGRNRVMNKNDFLRISTLLPGVSEQQKIADCLSSIDTLIAAEADKLEALKDHKKGLLQQLFPAPGETTPRLRFPEFHGAGEWEEQALGGLLQFPPNYGVNAPAAPFNPGLPVYLRITDISEDGRFIHENRMSVEVQTTPDNSMQAGDIALTRTGASVGKSYLHKEVNGPLVFAGFLIRIRPNLNMVLPEIVSQFFNSQRYWSWVEKTSTRSGQPGLNSAEFSALLIPLPKDNHGKGMQEQRKIADCLSSIDTIIVAQGDKINALKAHKQGLMQQLFPVADQVQA